MLPNIQSRDRPADDHPLDFACAPGKGSWNYGKFSQFSGLRTRSISTDSARPVRDGYRVLEGPCPLTASGWRGWLITPTDRTAVQLPEGLLPARCGEAAGVRRTGGSRRLAPAGAELAEQLGGGLVQDAEAGAGRRLGQSKVGRQPPQTSPSSTPAPHDLRPPGPAVSR
jgi:hypothetical protein